VDLDFNALMTTTKEVAAKSESLGAHISAIASLAERAKELNIALESVAAKQSELDARQIQLDANLRAIQLALANQEPRLLTLTDTARANTLQLSELKSENQELGTRTTNIQSHVSSVLTSLGSQQSSLNSLETGLEEINKRIAENQQSIKTVLTVASFSLIVAVVAVAVHFIN
jgi:chromosome segregation ATPase